MLGAKQMLLINEPPLPQRQLRQPPQSHHPPRPLPLPRRISPRSHHRLPPCRLQSLNRHVVHLPEPHDAHLTAVVARAVGADGSLPAAVRDVTALRYAVVGDVAGRAALVESDAAEGCEGVVGLGELAGDGEALEQAGFVVAGRPEFDVVFSAHLIVLDVWW